MKLVNILLIVSSLVLPIAAVSPLASALVKRADSDSWVDVSKGTEYKSLPKPPAKAQVTIPKVEPQGIFAWLTRWRSCNPEESIPSGPSLDSEIKLVCSRLSTGIIPPLTTWVVRRHYKGKNVEWFVHNFLLGPIWLDVRPGWCEREFKIVLDNCKGKKAGESGLGWTKDDCGFLIVHGVRYAKWE